MNAPHGTTRPVLLLTRRYPDAVMVRAGRDYRILTNEDDHPYGAEEMARRADGADALLVCAVDPVPAALIRALPDSVRMIATFSVGTDHIDLAAAKERGIVVANTPGVLTDATADIAFLLLLGAARTKGREAAFWERTITRGERTPEDFGRARELIIGSGAVGATLDLAGDYADMAKAALAALPASDWRAALEDLADFAVSRAA